MKQLKLKITDLNGKHWGDKKIMSMNWDDDGKVWMIDVDFMETGNSNDFTPFYYYGVNKNHSGEFLNLGGNLKGEIIPD